MPTLETIGGVLAFLVYAYLLYRQNKIMEEQNRIMREQAGSPASPIPKWRLKSYWPMVLMAALTIATWSAVGLSLYLRKPVVVERTVERPITVPCPEQRTPTAVPIPNSTPIKKPSTAEANPITVPKSPQPFTQNCPNGICNAGDNFGSQTVNNFVPQRRHLTDQQSEELGDAAAQVPLSQKLTVMSANDLDAIEYSGEIYRAIEKRAKSILTPGPQIAIAGFSGGEGHQPEGVVVCILDETDITFPYAQKLATALNSTSAPVNFTKCTGMTSGKIKIIVAQR